MFKKIKNHPERSIEESYSNLSKILEEANLAADKWRESVREDDRKWNEFANKFNKAVSNG